ncbi:hypothetical protein MTQ16_07440 [Corynebacterium bovis]
MTYARSSTSGGSASARRTASPGRTRTAPGTVPGGRPAGGVRLPGGVGRPERGVVDNRDLLRVRLPHRVQHGPAPGPRPLRVERDERTAREQRGELRRDLPRPGREDHRDRRVPRRQARGEAHREGAQLTPGHRAVAVDDRRGVGVVERRAEEPPVEQPAVHRPGAHDGLRGAGRRHVDDADGELVEDLAHVGEEGVEHRRVEAAVAGVPVHRHAVAVRGQLHVEEHLRGLADRRARHRAEQLRGVDGVHAHGRGEDDRDAAAVLTAAAPQVTHDAHARVGRVVEGVEEPALEVPGRRGEVRAQRQVEHDGRREVADDPADVRGGRAVVPDGCAVDGSRRGRSRPGRG